MRSIRSDGERGPDRFQAGRHPRRDATGDFEAMREPGLGQRANGGERLGEPFRGEYSLTTRR